MRWSGKWTFCGEKVSAECQRYIYWAFNQRDEPLLRTNSIDSESIDTIFRTISKQVPSFWRAIECKVSHLSRKFTTENQMNVFASQSFNFTGGFEDSVKMLHRICRLTRLCFFFPFNSRLLLNQIFRLKGFASLSPGCAMISMRRNHPSKTDTIFIIHSIFFSSYFFLSRTSVFISKLVEAAWLTGWRHRGDRIVNRSTRNEL